MNVSVTRLPESRVALKIELTPQEVDGALERTYKQLVQRVTVPGFRKGKAPRPVVERMVGPELFLHEATEEAVRWGYRKAIDQEKIVPIDEAEIDAVDEHDHVHAGEAFQFEATVAVRPEVQLPDYRAITIAREQVAVSDEDVNALLDELRERHATLEPVVRPAQIGDVVSLNIVGRADGEEVLNQDDFQFELQDEEADAQSSLPGMSRELVGANRADIKEVALSLPAIYPSSELAGKTLFTRVLLKEVKRKVLPELDDEFARSVGEFASLDELREALDANLEMERRLEADEKLVTEAVGAVTSRSFVDIPPILVEEEIDRMVDDFRSTLERQRLSLETYYEATGSTEERLRQEFEEGATTNVKTSLILGAIADRENIEVSSKEVDAALEDILRAATVSDSERRRLRASTAARANVRNRLRRARTVQRLVQIVTDGDDVAPAVAELVAEGADTEQTVAVEVGG